VFARKNSGKQQKPTRTASILWGCNLAFPKHKWKSIITVPSYYSVSVINLDNVFCILWHKRMTHTQRTWLVLSQNLLCAASTFHKWHNYFARTHLRFIWTQTHSVFMDNVIHIYRTIQHGIRLKKPTGTTDQTILSRYHSLLRTVIHADIFLIYSTTHLKIIFNFRILLALKIIVNSWVWPLEMQMLVKSDHKNIQSYR
jgi:hypothetical protein